VFCIGSAAFRGFCGVSMLVHVCIAALLRIGIGGGLQHLDVSMIFDLCTGFFTLKQMPLSMIFNESAIFIL